MSGYVAGPPKAHSHAIWTMSLYDSQAYMSAIATGTAAWPTASMAIYVPVKVRRPVIVTKLAISNGATVSGNVDVGVYNAAGTRLVAYGGGAQAGTSTEQVFDVTDTLLTPGTYYLAGVLDNTTGIVGADTDSAPLCACYGVLTQNSAYPLPSTATWVVNNTLAVYPVMAMLLNTIVS